jgi:hypothetical protein
MLGELGISTLSPPPQTTNTSSTENTSTLGRDLGVENIGLKEKVEAMEKVIEGLSKPNTAIEIASKLESDGSRTLPKTLVEVLEETPWKVGREDIIVKEESHEWEGWDGMFGKWR